MERSCSPKQLKRAYHKLSLKYHPDKYKGPGDSKQKFIDVSNGTVRVRLRSYLQLPHPFCFSWELSSLQSVTSALCCVVWRLLRW